MMVVIAMDLCSCSTNR